MQADRQVPIAFFLTGRRAGESLQPVDGLGLRPALLAGYEDLAALRHDFPLVLRAAGGEDAGVEALSGLFDRVLAQAAQGPDGDRVRKQGLRVEREIRRLVASGATGSLCALFTRAANHLAHEGVALEDSRRRLLAMLQPCDGELADCDAALPARLLRHLWDQAQHAKAQAFRVRQQRLVRKLSALLQSELERTPRGMSAQRLAATMAPGFASAFDFDAMSGLLVRSLPRAGLPAARRRRIQSLLRVLQDQRFFAAARSDGARGATYEFVFDSCAAAAKAWRDRLPKLAALARAIDMAELEVRGEYDPLRHDAVFQAQDPAAPDPADLAAFPDYLVCTDAVRLDAAENGRLMGVLSSRLPVKVLLQTDDLTGGALNEAPGVHGGQLASLAMALNTAYVLQASGSHLLRARKQLQQGLAFRGPALFSVYTGDDGRAAGLPPYLMAAAAMESRAFPAFAYDPSAGSNWAGRFTLEGNPQPERDWPVRSFVYEDEAHQRVAQELAFTAADFLAADPRHARSLARVPRAGWNGGLAGVEEALARPDEGLPEQAPALWMVDAQQGLHKVLVTRELLRQAIRWRDLWHNLQELAGIHNSHAEKLVAQAQTAWNEQLRQAAPAAASTVPAPAIDAAAGRPEPAATEEPQHAPDEPYIETARCSSCNECIQLNPKMFAYDANQQAYIADLSAGTYAQLVEAAESCQVAVIHPGKPRQPDEPGMPELLKRAEAFS